MSLANEIFLGAWMIDRQYAANSQDAINALMRGDFANALSLFSKKPEEYQPYNIGISAHGFTMGARGVIGVGENKADPAIKNIAVIPIQGPLMKGDAPCGGPVGYNTIANWYYAAADNSDIDAIVEDVDSPGGAVYGINTVEQAKNYARSKKPVLTAINDGGAYSAAYKIASHSTEIFATHAMCGVGSIGTMLTMRKDGPDVIYIYADESEEKNSDFHQALDGKPENIKKNMLNPLAKDFINTVKLNRESKINLEAGNPFKGKAFFAADGEAIGLIDGIKTFEEILLRAADLSDNYTVSNSNLNSEMKLFATNRFVAMAALAAFAAGTAIPDDKLEAANKELTAEGITGAVLISIEDATKAQGLDGELQQAKADKTTAEGKLADMQKNLDAAQKERDAANAKATAAEKERDTIKGRLSVGQTNLNHEEDDFGDDPEDSVIDANAEHNRTALEFLNRRK